MQVYQATISTQTLVPCKHFDLAALIHAQTAALHPAPSRIQHAGIGGAAHGRPRPRRRKVRPCPHCLFCTVQGRLRDPPGRTKPSAASAAAATAVAVGAPAAATWLPTTPAVPGPCAAIPGGCAAAATWHNLSQPLTRAAEQAPAWRLRTPAVPACPPAARCAPLCPGTTTPRPPPPAPAPQQGRPGTPRAGAARLGGGQGGPQPCLHSRGGARHAAQGSDGRLLAQGLCPEPV